MNFWLILKFIPQDFDQVLSFIEFYDDGWEQKMTGYGFCFELKKE